MSGEKGEIEVMEEQELETLPETTGIVGGALGIEDQISLAGNIEKMVEAQRQIRFALLKLAESGDWVIFGSAGKEKAEINFAGSMRIGSTLGISFTNWSAVKENGEDEKGKWFRWDYECDAIFRGRTIRVYGRAGSRDKFFGKAYGKLKELSDVDEGNIRQAARRGAMKEGVKVLFGLHHMDPIELAKHGVKMDRATSVEFKDEKAKSDETNVAAAVKIVNITVKKGDKWALYKIQASDEMIYSTFSETLAKEAKEFMAGGIAVDIAWKVGKYDREVVSIMVSEVKK